MSDPMNTGLRYPIITGTPTPAAGRKPQTGTGGVSGDGKSFQEMLDASMRSRTATTGVTFSKHAIERVALRGVELSPGDMDRLEQAVEKAGEKGITDSLVYLNDTAFVVNIPNRVVVTVVGGDSNDQTVITNIDGAVIG